jgi:hypothetical protein
MVEAEQVAARAWGVDGRESRLARRKAYARLRGLVSVGLLEHRRVLYGRPGVYVATRAGLEVADVELPAARVDLRTYEHDVEAVWLLLALERERGREAVLTERELRSVDAGAERPAFAAAVGERPASGYARLHFPDLAIVGDGGRPVAVELERTAKGATRLRRIVGAYVRARHLAGVRYYVTAPGVERAVAAAVRHHAAHDLVEIVRWGV